MNDQLDRAVRSVLADIISTAPEKDDHPIPTIGVDDTSTGAGRRYLLMVASVALVLVGLGGVALLNSRDAGRAPASAPPATGSTAVSTSTLTVVPATTAPTVPAGQADLYQQVGYRIAQGEAVLAALGFPNNEYVVDGEGATTVTASDPARPNDRIITIVMTPGTVLQPEDHTRTPVTVVEQTSTLIRVENHSNNGWTFSVQVSDTGGGPLPTLEQLQELIYSIDP